MTWSALLVGCAACYAAKLLGLSVPERILHNPRVARVATLLPVGLLATLIATQTFTSGHHLTFDARVAGLGVAASAQALRAPFIVVVAAAVAVTALVRLAA
jgi:branched-subunit amino acid transport protein